MRDWVQPALAKQIDLGYEARRRSRSTVEGNAVMLREMLSNLIDNAMRYTPAGGSVTVRVRADDGDASSCILEVEDTGPGIPPAEREHVFERFYRILGSDGDGSGLGLAIVREIAAAARRRDRRFSTIRAAIDPKLPGSLFRVSLALLEHAPTD